MALKQELTRLGSGFATAPLLDPTEPEPPEEAVAFFEDRYVPVDESGSAVFDHCPLTRPLSSSEAGVIEYVASTSRPTCSLVLTGHGGSGKSTLVKFLCYYLWARWPALRARFLPVYVALSDQYREVASMKDVAQLTSLLVADVDAAVQPFAIDRLFEHPAQVLRWVHTHAGLTWVGAFPEPRISELIAGGLGNWLAGLAPGEKKDLIHELVRYCAQKVTHVAVFIDNLDRFGVDIHRSLLFFGEELLRDGFLPILVMRKSTFVRLDNEYTEKVARRVEVSPSDDVLRRIVAKTVAEGRLHRFGGQFKVDATAEDVVNVVLSSIGDGEELATLLRLSNRSLHSLYKKLGVIADSHHLDEPTFVRSLLEVRTLQPVTTERMPPWMFYHLLLGNHGGSFNSDTYPPVAGLINLFCNRHRHSHRPLSYYCRLLLLTRLLDPSTDTPAFARLGELNREFSELFSWELSCATILQRSWFRLIQSHLALTRSCRHYRDEASMILAFADDSVAISESGRFYLTDFCAKLEYLYFMKDDIDWPPFDGELAATRDGMRPVQVGETRLEKAEQTLRALILLNSLEASLLERLLESRRPDSAVLYSTSYSPRKFSPADATVFFSRFIANRMRRYLARHEPRALATNLWHELIERFKAQEPTEDAFRD